MRRSLALTLLAFGFASCVSRGGPTLGVVTTLTRSRVEPHAYGRRGDLVLEGEGGARLVFAAAPDPPFHRPLRGALVDAARGDGDRSDPLLWLRAGFFDPNHELHLLVASEVTGARCGDGARGVASAGFVDGVTLDTRVCPLPGGRFVFTTTAHGLPSGASLGDEMNTGTAHLLTETANGPERSSFLAVAEHGVSLLLQSAGMHVERRLVHIAAETFSAPVTLRYEGPIATRTLQVLDGDAFDALSRVAPSARVITVHLGRDPGASPGARVALLGEAPDAVLAEGNLDLGDGQQGRTLRLPPVDGAAFLALYDAYGVLAERIELASLPLLPAHNERTLGAAPRGTVSFTLVGDDGLKIPAHVLVRGAGSTPDPTVRVTASAAEGVVTSGRSVYLKDGQGEVSLPPGDYAVTASHGPAFTLATGSVHVHDGARVPFAGTLRRAVDTTSWTAADFHLHAAPSPDSSVTLDARVISLACEGVELAVATDHNRLTDYAPSVARLGVGDRLVTLMGDEITTAGARGWGHFNAFPFEVGQAEPEEAVPPYFGLEPAAIFAGARDHGARIVQANHPRMGGIGYFELTGFDARTGHASEAFSGAFDAMEAFNGMWIESPDRIREGARDLVGLARRGLHVAATGNSDSHLLLYEEAGYPRTYVRSPAWPASTRASRLLDALVAGDTIVSSGPLVELTVNGARPGSTVKLTGPLPRSVRAHLRVSAPAWVPVEHVELWQDDRVVARLPVTAPRHDGVRFEADLEVPIAADAVMLAWADADEPLPDVIPYPHARSVGFTGLLYVDADGDGRVIPPAAPLP